MLKCPSIGHDGTFKYYLVADLQEVCFRGRHLHYLLALTIPQIVLYVIGIPAAAAILIHRNIVRIKRNDADFRMRYGILYEGYRHDCAWWESVIAGRKVAIILIGMIGTSADIAHMQA